MNLSGLLQRNGPIESLLSQKAEQLQSHIQIGEIFRSRDSLLSGSANAYTACLNLLKERGRDYTQKYARENLHWQVHPRVREDIQSIIETGKPLFENFTEIPQIDARREAEKAARAEAESRIKKALKQKRREEMERQAAKRRELADQLGVNPTKLENLTK